MRKHACIVGMGLTGLSLVRHYRRQGWDVRVVDDRTTPPQLTRLGEEFPELRCTHLDSYVGLADFAADCDAVAVSPGIPLRNLPADLVVIGDLEVFADAWHDRWPQDSARPRWAAITGTNGKSTVTQLVAALAVANGVTAAAVGNIGTPMLDAYADWETQGWPDVVAMEVSSFQLAATHKPLGVDVGALLNLAPDHLDWHADFADYVVAKRKVFAGAHHGIYDAADARLADFATTADEKSAFNSNGSAPRDGWGICTERLQGPAGHTGPTCTDLTRAGIMPASACAALTVVAALVSPADITAQLNCLTHAHGLDHRLQALIDVDGVTFINDSKATNVAATCQALAAVATRCVPIFGGVDKGQDFTPLATTAQAHAVPGAVLLHASAALRDALAESGIASQVATTMADAVAQAHALAQEAKVTTVLLSPACASYDNYTNYIARGDAFALAVEDLA